MEYESKVLGSNTTYWRFLENATPQTFAAAFEQFVVAVNRPEIDRLMVVMEMRGAAGVEILDLWYQTGRVAQEAGIRRWGIVIDESEVVRRLAIAYQVKGRGEPRSYEHLISSSHEEVERWCLAAGGV